MAGPIGMGTRPRGHPDHHGQSEPLPQQGHPRLNPGQAFLETPSCVEVTIGQLPSVERGTPVWAQPAGGLAALAMGYEYLPFSHTFLPFLSFLFFIGFVCYMLLNLGSSHKLQ